MSTHVTAFRDWIYIITLAKRGLCSSCTPGQASRMAQIQGRYLIKNNKLDNSQIKSLIEAAYDENILIRTSRDMLNLLSSSDLVNIKKAVNKNARAFFSPIKTQKTCTEILKERKQKAV